MDVGITSPLKPLDAKALTHSPPDRTPRRTIGGKLNRLVIVSVGVALLLGGVLSCYLEAQRFLQSKRDVMFATAQVFAAASSRAVAANDATAVLQAIRAVARLPGLVYVEVRARDGSSLADLGTGERLNNDTILTLTSDPSPFSLVFSKTLTLRIPIIDGGRTVGEIELVGDTTGLARQFWTVLISALLCSMAALGIGLACSLRLQRSITRPLRRLTQAMLEIERTGDYRAPVRVISDDETGLLAARFNSMILEIGEATRRLLAREKEIIERLARAGEMRDDQTGQHVVRVAKVSRLIAEELHLSPVFVEDLCRASPMHDVGKIAISDAILHKPGALDPEERREMEQHTLRGFEILRESNSELVQLAAEIALSHHERWDGRGYPRQLAGTAIPLSGRITAVADVCDALLSERPYKSAWSLTRVHDLLVKEAGEHFDPDCVAALIARWDELQRIYGAQPRMA